HASRWLSASGRGARLVIPGGHRAHELAFWIAVELRERNGHRPSSAHALLRALSRLAGGVCERPHHAAHAREKTHHRDTVLLGQCHPHQILPNWLVVRGWWLVVRGSWSKSYH